MNKAMYCPTSLWDAITVLLSKLRMYLAFISSFLSYESIVILSSYIVQKVKTPENTPFLSGEN